VSADVLEEHIPTIFRVKEISSARNQRESRWLSYFFNPEDGGNMVLRNVG
jgi:hypothetical protein